MKPKRILCLVLSMLLLTGCATQPVSTMPTTVPATQPTSFQDTLLHTEAYTEPRDAEARMAYRRDLVESEMRFMMSLLWTTPEDITYTHATDPVTLKAGLIYQGIPYTHGGGSGFGFMTFAAEQDGRGVYTISGLEGKHMTGQTGTARVGNDCADAVFWAWSRVSDSITFTCTNEMTENYGCLKVGDYLCNRTKYGSTTKTVITENGEDRMMECYAQLQKGDAMVLYTNGSGGHAVMVADVHVEYRGTEIDRHLSYVTILEQISSQTPYYSEELGQTVYRLCGIDTRWSFSYLLSKGYLPITCRELIDTSPIPMEVAADSVQEPTFETMLTGTVTANRPISSLTVVITDAEGSTVQQATCYRGQSGDRNRFRVDTFTNPIERLLMQGICDPDALPPGQYRCVLTCQLSTGRIFTLRDFPFTIPTR